MKGAFWKCALGSSGCEAPSTSACPICQNEAAKGDSVKVVNARCVRNLVLPRFPKTDSSLISGPSLYLLS